MYQLRYISAAEADLEDGMLRIHPRFTGVEHRASVWRIICQTASHLMFIGNANEQQGGRIVDATLLEDYGEDDLFMTITSANLFMALPSVQPFMYHIKGNYPTMDIPYRIISNHIGNKL